MENKPNNSFNNRQDEDKKLVLYYIRKKVEKGTGIQFPELTEKYNQEQLFNIGLKHVTTTKKAICVALNIPVEGACRYKRKAEKKGLLVQSFNKMVCPYTSNFAHVLSTDPNEFFRLSKINQLNLFDDE